MDDTSGLCPCCATHPVAICSRCSKSKAIYNLEKQLCKLCNQRIRQGKRQRKKRIPAQCSICGQIRPSALVREAICRSCYAEKTSGRGNCSQCDKFVIYFIKKERLCKQCDKRRKAPKALQRYISAFRTPYPYNKTLFDLFVTTINWKNVTVTMHYSICFFGRFLQTKQLPEFSTWEVIEAILPPLGATGRNKPKLIRKSLVRVAHMLVKHGKLENWEDYLPRRNAMLSMSYAPEHTQELLHRYVDWMRERKSVWSNIREHLYWLARFWQWCEICGIRSPEQVQASLIQNYLMSLYWHWQCSLCQNTMPFDPANRKAPGSCTHCNAIGSLTKQKRYAQNTVRRQRGILLVFFDWLKISRKVLANPVRSKTFMPEKTIRHYPLEVIKQLCIYIRKLDADPTEAFILYLIIFHGLSVKELRHALLPNVIPMHQGISVSSLADAYYITLPRPAPSLGDRTPGRPDTRLDFPSSASSWLKLLLIRFEKQRQLIPEASKNQHVLTTVQAAHRNTIVCHAYICDKVGKASQRCLKVICNPNTLCKTTGIMFADRVGAGILEWMGWDRCQAFAYSYATREVVQPRSLSTPQIASRQGPNDPVIFPAPKNSH